MENTQEKQETIKSERETSGGTGTAVHTGSRRLTGTLRLLVAAFF